MAGHVNRSWLVAVDPRGTRRGVPLKARELHRVGTSLSGVEQWPAANLQASEMCQSPKQEALSNNKVVTQHNLKLLHIRDQLARFHSKDPKDHH